MPTVITVIKTSRAGQTIHPFPSIRELVD